MLPVTNKALAAYTGHTSANLLPIARQALAAASANNSTALAAADADVNISDAAKVLQQVSDSQQGNLPGVTILYGQAKLQAPTGATGAEALAYQRNGLAVDTSSQPWRLLGTDTPLNEQSWKSAESEIDQIVAQRVALYQQAKASGDSEQDVVDKLVAYNRTLPERYTNLVGPGGDLKQLPKGEPARVTDGVTGVSGSAGSEGANTHNARGQEQVDQGQAQQNSTSPDASNQDRSAWLRTRLKSLV